jgi:hypothetical protein
MPVTPDTIWRVPAYLPYLQPPLTAEAVASTERQIGYKLPAEYLDLLRKQNGGYIRYSLPEMVHDSIAGIGPHFPSLSQFDWEECQEHVGYPLQGLIPFDGDGHWHLCLDYRKDRAVPSVTHADIECDQETPIAGSFAEYLSLLRIDDRDQYVLEGVVDVERVREDLTKLLRVTFDSPDTWASGYPVHRGRMGSEEQPEWVWISPNSVPRGFVRPDEPRYAELKGLLPGRALRYPDLPEDGYILGATDRVRSQVIDACAQSRMRVRPLSDYLKDA